MTLSDLGHNTRVARLLEILYPEIEVVYMLAWIQKLHRKYCVLLKCVYWTFILKSFSYIIHMVVAITRHSQ